MLDVRVSCPAPAISQECVSLAHGAGGRESQQLLDTVFRPAFAARATDLGHDGAVGEVGGRKLAFTTDSYVVRPLFFPGGTIGDLAVNGTVNDLAMCGARPLWLSAAFVLEEGLPMGDLRAIVTAMRDAARAAGVAIVTGDTKVVERGKADAVFITTAGVGVVEHAAVSPARVRPGDAMIVSGDLGAHAAAIMSVRDGMEADGTLQSDTASLWPAVEALFAAGIDVHCLRDLTRGGLAAALNEIALAAGVTIVIDEAAVKMTPAAHVICDLLGVDPVYAGSEGRFVAFVARADVRRAVEVLRGVEVSRDAALAGFVEHAHQALVTMRSRFGGWRAVDLLSGAQLARVC